MNTSERLAMAQVSSMVGAAGLQGSAFDEGQNAVTRATLGSAQAAVMALAQQKAQEHAEGIASRNSEGKAIIRGVYRTAGFVAGQPELGEQAGESTIDISGI